MPAISTRKGQSFRDGSMHSAQGRRLPRRPSVEPSLRWIAEPLENRMLLSAVSVSGISDGQVITAGESLPLNVSGIEAGGDLTVACSGLSGLTINFTSVQLQHLNQPTAVTAGSLGYTDSTTPTRGANDPFLYTELVTGPDTGTTGGETGPWVLQFRSDLVNESPTRENSDFTPNPNGAFSVGPTLFILYTDPHDVQSTFIVQFQEKAAANPGQLQFKQQPRDADSKATLKPFTVAIEDTNGAVRTTDNATLVSLDIQGLTNPIINGTATQRVVAGVATFNDISIEGSGAFRFSASDDQGDPAVLSNPFNITGDHLVFKRQPRTTTAGATMDAVTVVAEDRKKHIDLNNNTQVDLTITSGPTGGTLGGTTSVVMINGIATFSDLTVDKAGVYVLRADNAGATFANSRKFKAAPPKLKFSSIEKTFVRETLKASNEVPAIGVSVLDVKGKIDVADTTDIVSIAILSGPAGAVLSGTTAVTVAAGVASFSDLSVDKPGKYVFQAIDSEAGIDARSKKVSVQPVTLRFILEEPTDPMVNQPLVEPVTDDTFVPGIFVLLAEEGHRITPAVNDHSQVTITLQALHGGDGHLFGTTTSVIGVSMMSSASGLFFAAAFRDLTIDAPGRYRLIATDSDPNVKPGKSLPFVVT